MIFVQIQRKSVFLWTMNGVAAELMYYEYINTIQYNNNKGNENLK